MMLTLQGWLKGQTSEQIREPAVAGTFYPGNPRNLTMMVEEFLENARTEISGEIGGLVSPHAGYVYSGPVAGWSYKQLINSHYQLVVVIAPSHFKAFPGVSVYGGDYYETPLGKIPVDQETAGKLADQSAKIEISEFGHENGSTGRGEHSLEVQLPFLQIVLKDFKLLPVVMGDQSWQNCESLGKALKNSLPAEGVLIVASSDLSHYHGYDSAYQLDENILKLFKEFNYKAIVEGCSSRSFEACGFGPIAAMMYACELRDFEKSKVLDYATSGDVPIGDKSRVVGYMSGAVYR